MTSKADYLKKYLSAGSGDQEKKKKKSKSKDKPKGLRLIEEDAFLSVAAAKAKDIGSDEELEEIEVLKQSVKKAKVVHGFKKTFAEIAEPKKVKEEPLSPENSPPRKQRHDSDESPARPARKRHDSDNSPPRSRRQRHDSENDNSPPRRPAARRRHDSDNSPPRQRTRKDSDSSPVRRRTRHDSDNSPPRKVSKGGGAPTGANYDEALEETDEYEGGNSGLRNRRFSKGGTAEDTPVCNSVRLRKLIRQSLAEDPETSMQRLAQRVKSRLVSGEFYVACGEQGLTPIEGENREHCYIKTDTFACYVLRKA
uniref:Ground-like domain-containing protein n=1 Tax=Caenorhabditis japonica TaxID=281687 RepID=A0A8R1IAR2_CAEJA